MSNDRLARDIKRAEAIRAALAADPSGALWRLSKGLLWAYAGGFVAGAITAIILVWLVPGL